MATINELGNIQAICPGCDGALSSYEWQKLGGNRTPLGAVTVSGTRTWNSGATDFRLYRCSGCGTGALAVVEYIGSDYPGDHRKLMDMFPSIRARLRLPKAVPQGIQNEYREGERCMASNCMRAAAGMFRSVLDKALRANGYKLKAGTTLEQQIDLATQDGVITKARQTRAHQEVRVLGNDVLHDDWHEIDEADVEAAHHYTWRILEDFYDDRPAVLTMLKAAGRAAEDLELPLA